MKNACIKKYMHTVKTFVNGSARRNIIKEDFSGNVIEIVHNTTSSLYKYF